MKNRKSHFLSFSSISLSEPAIHGPTARSEVTLHSIHEERSGTNRSGIKKSQFILEIRYEKEIQKSQLPLLRMSFCMPLLNYGLFTEKLRLDFPLAESDYSLLNDLNTVFSRDIFVNKILRRRANYILPEFLPDPEAVQPEEASPRAKIEPTAVHPDEPLSKGLNENSCGVLSSGGKESLLTYGLLSDAGAEVHPLYVNESGGHWRTALTAYRYHKETDSRTGRIWTNVDRFYNFMLDHLHFIRPDHRKVRADTYPIRLCIFPFYVFALLPIFIKKRISGLLIGSEFDDFRSQPEYLGIPHYFGIYDQHQDFDLRMNDWYSRRVPGLSQWSAVRNITGLIVERILIDRYPHLAKTQRSCHSCHFDGDEIIPCGTCSKCLGVLLFVMANGGDPKMMRYREEDIASFIKRSDFSSLRLDQEEKDHSLFLLKEKKTFPKGYHEDRQEANQEGKSEGKGEEKQGVQPGGRQVDHIEQIHIDDKTCDPKLIPDPFREKIFEIIEEYTSGYCLLSENRWIPRKPPDYF